MLGAIACPHIIHRWQKTRHWFPLISLGTPASPAYQELQRSIWSLSMPNDAIHCPAVMLGTWLHICHSMVMKWPTFPDHRRKVPLHLRYMASPQLVANIHNICVPAAALTHFMRPSHHDASLSSRRGLSTRTLSPGANVSSLAPCCCLFSAAVNLASRAPCTRRSTSIIRR